MSYTKYLHADNSGEHTIVEALDIEGSPHQNPEKLADYSYIQMQMKYLMGQVLTIVDASFYDPVQRKAVKDLMRNHWAETYSRTSDDMLDVGTLEVPDEAEELEEVSPEEALGA